MRSLSKREQKQAAEKIQLLAFLRQKDGLSEEEIAAKLGFGSVDAMHIQMKHWGVPEWLAEGGSAEHNRTGARHNAEEPERHARTADGDAVELPQAYEAAPLFHQALKQLGWFVSDLQHRKEYLQDGRFVSHEAYQHWVHWPERGIDEIASVSVPQGGHQSPAEPLTTLIAVYVLSRMPLEPLLEKLHPNPTAIDRDQLNKLIEGKKTANRHDPGLKSRARHIARAICGGEVRGGQTLENSRAESIMGPGTGASSKTEDSLTKQSLKDSKKRASRQEK
jgi:hypothetical protein